MLTNLQKEILDGAMLGDGSFFKGKRAKNAYLSYTSNKLDHVDYIFQHFKEFCGYAQVKMKEIFDKRTQKTYTRYYFTSKSFSFFTELHDRWYKPKKIVPDNIILTPTTKLVWYIGDGCLRKDGRIVLCTNCFSEESIREILLPQLINYTPTIGYSRKEPMIIIPRNKSRLFLNDIGECPVRSYSYKWDIKDYIIPARENKIYRTSKDEIAQFVKLYKSGMSYYAIAKEFNYSVSRVCHCLQRYKDENGNSIFINGKNSKEVVLTIDQIHKIIEMRHQGKSIAVIMKELNLGRSTILRCLKNREIERGNKTCYTYQSQ